MNELGPKARSLIDAVQEADEPNVRDLARVRAKLDARLGLAGAAATMAASMSAKASAGVGIGAGTAVGSGAAGGSLFGGAALATGKVVLAVALTGASVTAGISVYRAEQGSPVEPTPAAAKLVSRPAERGALPAPAAPRQIAAREPDVERLEQPNAERAPQEARLPEPRRREPVALQLPREDSVKDGEDSVKDEAALLASARAAIGSGDAELALERLDEHAIRFPRGVLVQERRAARVLALCASGRASEARAAAEAFIAENPRSPLVSSVRRACSATVR